MKAMKKMMTVLAVAGLVLALAPAAQAATITWTGGGGNDLWSNVANWDVDPTTGGPHVLQLTIADTSILDTDTSAWTTGPLSVLIGGNHTVILATGGILTTENVISQWIGTLKFEGGTLGNPFYVSGSPRLQTTGIIEFHAGIFQEARISGEDIYISHFTGGIHVIGKTAGADFNPQYFRYGNTDTASFQFTMVDGEGVDKIALSAPSLAFRQSTGTAPKFALTVDGIQDYLDGGGTQSEWVLMTSAQATSDPTDDLTLVQAGSVDGGLGTVTTTYNEVLLTLNIPKGGNRLTVPENNRLAIASDRISLNG